jgi:uncharacterized ion transporter superfamily protein YfcC
MTLVPVMWMVWAVLVILMTSLHLYRSSLEKNEDDQIFLDDSFSHEKAEQAAIATKVGKVEPLLKATRWLVIAMTVLVVVYYVWDVLLQLHLVGS